MLGPRVGSDPQCHNFTLGIQTCWYLKMLKFALPPTPNLKFVLPPTQTPKASQWNIGCVGSPMQNSRVGHVHFFFVCVNFIRGGCCFSVEYGLKVPVVLTQVIITPQWVLSHQLHLRKWYSYKERAKNVKRASSMHASWRVGSLV